MARHICDRTFPKSSVFYTSGKEAYLDVWESSISGSPSYKKGVGLRHVPEDLLVHDHHDLLDHHVLDLRAVLQLPLCPAHMMAIQDENLGHELRLR